MTVPFDYDAGKQDGALYFLSWEIYAATVRYYTGSNHSQRQATREL